MNPQTQTETPSELFMYSDVALSETDLLADWGFDPHEIASLLWLRQWYQNGGGDPPSLRRPPEFLPPLGPGGGLSLKRGRGGGGRAARSLSSPLFCGHSSVCLVAFYFVFTVF